MGAPELLSLLLPSNKSSGSFSADHEEDQIDDKQQDHCHLQREHPAIAAIGLEDQVQVVEGFELFVDGAVPVAEVEAGGEALVEVGEVPVAEEFGDVQQFVAKASQIDANFAQLALNARVLPAREALGKEIAIGPIDGVIGHTHIEPSGFLYNEGRHVLHEARLSPLRGGRENDRACVDREAI